MARGPKIARHLTTRWAEFAHIATLNALASHSGWSFQDFAFHGGTSLHLSWRSPRYSEDLDFLISREVDNIDAVMKRVAKRVGERFLLVDPLIRVELRDRTKDAARMPKFDIVLTHPNMDGKVLVKAEFWRVDREYLRKYPTEHKTPLSTGDYVAEVSSPMPAATLEAAFSDKLTAFATRPHLKWRDIFDLWWIGNQTGTTISLDNVVPQFLHNVSAYQTRGNKAPSEALLDFLDKDLGEVVALADPDLRNWLSDSDWTNCQPPKMVEYVRKTLAAVAAHIEAHALSEEGGGPSP